MRSSLELIGELSLLGLGVAGWTGAAAMPTGVAIALTAVGLLLVGLRLLSVTFIAEDHPWSTEPAAPRALRIGMIDYAKALVSWLLGFRRTYGVAPGLYYTGESYDRETPLLVTANYHLSVFLVVRRVRELNARLLVIDSDAINVWCAAGKGRFGNEQIELQLARYPREILSKSSRPRLILPKLAMSGVDLRALREQDVRPIVGPLYAKDLPTYLAAAPFRNRSKDRVSFDLQSRAFVLVPGLLQLLALSAAMTVAVWALGAPFGRPVPLAIVGVTAAMGVAYVLLFPWIPGGRFAVKGVWLGLLFAGAFLALVWTGKLPLPSLAGLVPFTLATGILTGLEFTGSSAVSNYSRVKLEIAGFLPATALLFIVSLAAFVAGCI